MSEIFEQEQPLPFNYRVTILKSDSVVLVDNIGQSNINLSFMDSNISTVQWYFTYGTVEYNDSTPQIQITDFTPYMQAYNNWNTAYQANTDRPETYYLKSNWRESRKYKLNETPNLILYTTLTPLENELFQIFSEGIWQVDMVKKQEVERLDFNSGLITQINGKIYYSQVPMMEIALGINVTENTATLTTLRNEIVALQAQIIPPPEDGH